MSTLMVGYDLKKPGQNYSKLIDGIKQLGSWAHPLDSTWFVVTSKSVAQVRDHLAQFIDSGDALMVLNPATSAWATSGVSQDVNNWLRQHL